MKIRLIAVLMGAVALCPVFAGGSRDSGHQSQNAAPGAASYTIEVGGSTSVTPLMELLAADYQKARPTIKININGTGSGDGINNAGGLYQIGMSSRELTPAEQGKGLKEATIAIDGIAVIVNSSNPVGNLSLEQIKNIYTGAITDWSQVSGGAKNGKIAVVSREEGSGTRGAFEELVGFQGQLLQGANESTSTGAIKAGIAQNQDAIGYISLGSLDNTVKSVDVGGVAATNANVVNGSYKIARPFIVMSGSNVHPESTAFLEWILSPAGQAIVKTSWIPVK
ncbi:MAG: phosphate ABC transporter substrate-binding protein [Treponema sp.]|jgi:phosphate transport system substrate-binding protein|nr:phosphate ABC transporter substrate-binding protein [Treponema sp.]